MNSAACGAYAVTSKEARRILAYTGDVATESLMRFEMHKGPIDTNPGMPELHDAWAA